MPRKTLPFIPKPGDEPVKYTNPPSLDELHDEIKKYVAEEVTKQTYPYIFELGQIEKRVAADIREREQTKVLVNKHNLYICNNLKAYIDQEITKHILESEETPLVHKSLINYHAKGTDNKDILDLGMELSLECLNKATKEKIAEIKAFSIPAVIESAREGFKNMAEGQLREEQSKVAKITQRFERKTGDLAKELERQIAALGDDLTEKTRMTNIILKEDVRSFIDDLKRKARRAEEARDATTSRNVGCT